MTVQLSQRDRLPTEPIGSTADRSQLTELAPQQKENNEMIQSREEEALLWQLRVKHTASLLHDAAHLRGHRRVVQVGSVVLCGEIQQGNMYLLQAKRVQIAASLWRGTPHSIRITESRSGLRSTSKALSNL